MKVEQGDSVGDLSYHLNLVSLLALCTEGKNVATEIKCHSLLPLDELVRVVTHPECIPEVSGCGFIGGGGTVLCCMWGVVLDIVWRGI